MSGREPGGRKNVEAPAGGPDRAGFPLLWVGIFFIYFSIVAIPNANAYIDPGTGSYVFQVVIGVLLGAAVAVKMFWRRIWRFVTRRSTHGPAEPPARTNAGEPAGTPAGED
jgi:hypothetical protein